MPEAVQGRTHHWRIGAATLRHKPVCAVPLDDVQLGGAL
jgi:hypothetical protein